MNYWRLEVARLDPQTRRPTATATLLLASERQEIGPLEALGKAAKRDQKLRELFSQSEKRIAGSKRPAIPLNEPNEANPHTR
jgi:hypothetical protein